MERIRPSGVLAEKAYPSGAWIVSALWRGYRQARTYYGYTKREAVRLYIEEMNGQADPFKAGVQVNQTLEVPAGTRCECMDRGCAGAGLARFENDPKTDVNEHEAPGARCFRDAVRMVTVRGLEGLSAARRIPYGADTSWQNRTLTAQVPLCAACADYAESKVAK